MVDMAIDAGVTLFDTADIYDFGTSEEFLGRALAGRRDNVVLATKVGNAMSEDPAERGLSRRWIVQSCEASLRRLGTDHIDLYQMHRPDPRHTDRRDAGGFRRVGAIGEGGRHRHVDLLRRSARRGQVGRRAAQVERALQRAAAVLHPRARLSRTRCCHGAGNTTSACWCGRR